MGFQLTPIDVVDDINGEDFRRHYLKPRRPLVIKNLSRRWPGYEKWSLDYMKAAVGDITVPVYDSSKADPAAPINAAGGEMPFGDYIELIKRGPTDWRIFLFDPIRHAPSLLQDYAFPTGLMDGFLDKHPKLFFGGAGSETFLHYDIDMAHIFHTHFGRKHVILFDYKWKERLYRIPFATYALEDYRVDAPDTDRFPALEGVEGVECHLEYGDTLFMPCGWWHWMKYLDGSFSISLRAWDASWRIKAHSLWNLTVQRQFDNMMKARYRARYMHWKERLAVKRAEKALAQKRPY